MDKEKVLIIVQQYTEKVLNILSPDQIVLFGSYATNTAHENSDIDIAVFFNGFNDDYLKVSGLLWRLTFEINFHIEPILVDINDDPSGFVNHILLTGITVYKK
ncbi:MAG: nucleotidyltransferase domain-containing protein [Deltaproteobacteria bacterium]|jgi:predicted nucleotidyltransferase|nr:nucleotidyltransferase domain-containing protein [Deltaproteobacteria bacterium]